MHSFVGNTLFPAKRSGGDTPFLKTSGSAVGLLFTSLSNDNDDDDNPSLPLPPPPPHHNYNNNSSNNSDDDNDNNNNNNNNNKNNNHERRIERCNSRSFAISLRRKRSPSCTLKWPGRNRVQITCNTSDAHRVQHVVCHVV